MARYVILIRYTEQGLRALKKSPDRAAAFRKAVEQAGVKVESQLWTLGPYDGLVVLSAGKAETILKAVGDLAALGNVRTETLQAFDAKEVKDLLG